MYKYIGLFFLLSLSMASSFSYSNDAKFTKEDQGIYRLKSKSNPNTKVFRFRKQKDCWSAEDRNTQGGWYNVDCKNPNYSFSRAIPHNKIEEIIGVTPPPPNIGSVYCLQSSAFSICKLTRANGQEKMFSFSMVLKNGQRKTTDMILVTNTLN